MNELTSSSTKPTRKPQKTRAQILRRYEARLYREWRQLDAWHRYKGARHLQSETPMINALLTAALRDYRRRRYIHEGMEFRHAIGDKVYRKQSYSATNLGRVVLLPPDHTNYCKIASGFGMF